MLRRTVMTAALLTAMSAPVGALDLDAMSAKERDAFGAAVREYLLTNPEVLMEAIGVLEEREAEMAQRTERSMVAANSDAIFNDDHSYVGGNPDGDVVMVEFIDYRCSFCRRAHPEIHQLVNTDGNIRKIIKEFPILGDESVNASRFAISTLRNAGPEAYALVNDALIIRRGDFSERGLARLAEELGLDADTIIEGMDDPEVDEIIAANRALAQQLQITGTPTFVVGDQLVRGYVPLEGMREVVASVRGE